MLNNRIRKVTAVGIISTVAGNGILGYNGDGIQATAANLARPPGIAVDGVGNLYIGDATNKRVRKVDATGIITTIAGSGSSGFYGDGGPATAALLANPAFAATYCGGNVCVLDAGNNRIRMIINNNAPSFTHGTSQTLNVCKNSGAHSINTQMAITDAEVGQPETWGVIQPPAHGMLVAAYSATSTGGTITPTGLSYTPSPGYSGPDSFKVRIADCSFVFGATTVYVSVLDAPVVSPITGATSLCQGAATTLSCATPGGIWNTSATAIATVTGGIVAGTGGGTVAISYTVSNSCFATSVTRSVTVTPLPSAGTIVGAAGVCLGATATLSATAAGGTWVLSNLNATHAPTGSHDVLTGVTVGTVSVMYIVSNSCGKDTARRLFSINTLPVAGAISGPASVCVGGTITLSDNATGGGWSTATPGIAATGLAAGIITSMSAGPAIITYTVPNACGIATATYTVDVLPLPDAGTITGTPKVCVGGTISLVNTVSGTWTGGPPAIATVDAPSGAVTGLSPGVAAITFTPASTNGCTAFTTTTISVIPGPLFTISATMTQIPCYGANSGTIAVAVSGGNPPYSFAWSAGAADPTIINLDPGVYPVLITELLTQCKKADTFTISQPDSLIGITHTTRDSCKSGNGTMSVVAMGGTMPYSYAWSNNGTGDSVTGVKSGPYSVTITDANSCVKTLSVTVESQPCDDIHIHDVITANGDGQNDTWVIEGLQNYPNNLVQVFSKLGDIVYEQAAYNNDWAGKETNGNLLPDGTFYYLVHLNAPNAAGGDNVFKGSLLIKR